MKLGRWSEVTASNFPWEREALEFLRERLPDTEPFRAWSNFEFIADDGSINEVDLLVVSLYRIFLVEIKSRSGRLRGDPGTWEWEAEGRTFSEDNPLFLANRKSKKLKSLLQRQSALRRHRAPYVEPVIYLSGAPLRCELEGTARAHVYLREDAGRGGPADVVVALSGEERPEVRGKPAERVDRTVSKAIGRAMEQAGIRPSQRQRRVGDFTLGDLILETDVYQDFEATHVSHSWSRRRLRLYPDAVASSQSTRKERREAAEREFRLLDGVVHPGILRVENYIEHERGPALVFEHDPGTERLDHFLRRRVEMLDIGRRLDLMRKIAEAVQYAHSRRLYHRALSPQTILVTDPDSLSPGVKIYDWQAGRRDASTGARVTIDQTVHVGLAGDQQSMVYLAPELLSSGGFDDVRLDVFSLGAIAYHLFSGQPPAPSIDELHAKLAGGRGLKLSEMLDGASEKLQVLIELATDPNVEDRPASVSELMVFLDELEEELTTPAPDDTCVHPLDASVGDRLEGGFEVKKRLGTGSTCVALLVERDGRQAVLKVARDPTHNGRIRREGEILARIRHQHVVQLYETLEFSDHVALLLEKAGADSKSGTYTLAERLREEGRLSLDLLQRFGEELLEVVDWLERNGISHRDIKPDNIGIAESSGRALTLVLFDFSLSGAPAEDIRAGTPAYLDPFLRLRKPPRWDPYAERFAAAMTLYEMATGQLPTWGDGQSDPAIIHAEVTLDSDLFDPAVRDELSKFFRKSLARDARQRFDNAEEIRRAWQRVFMDIDVRTAETDHGEPVDLNSLLKTASEAAPLSALGLSARLLNALDRIGAHTIGELLALPRIRLYRNKGIGQRAVREIRDLAEKAAQAFAEQGEQPSGMSTTLESEPPVDSRFYSIDLITQRIVPSWPEAEDVQVLQTLLGLDDAPVASPSWPAPDTATGVAGVPARRVHDVLDRARERWARRPWMTALRDDLARLLEKNAGIMSAKELFEALLAIRGSVIKDAGARLQAARAVAYAAVETEALRETARFVIYRGDTTVFVCATESLAEHLAAAPSARGRYAEALGARADELAAADPLLATVRALEALREVPPPAGEPPPPPERLLRLAVEASHRAALSSRREIYPKRMPAVRALKLGAGSLLGPKELTVRQIRSRLASRYPEAAPVPDPPELDRLLAEAGVEIRRVEGGDTYRSSQQRPSYLTSTSTLHRLRTGTGAAQVPGIDDARTFEDRLQKALRDARFFALVVPPKRLLHAEKELLARFSELERVSLEALLIERMHEGARAAGASWDLVLRADAAALDSRDWRNLNRLVSRTIPRIERELAERARPILLMHPGLLARYGQIELLGRMRDACDRGGAPAARLVLVAGDAQQSLPMVEAVVLPVIHPSEWARIPEAWLANVHRAAPGAA